MLGKSEIRFLPHGGRRVAYEIRGDGPPLVAPAWWVSHLELDWQSADFRRFWDGVADGYTLIRYDRLGVGMSDRTMRGADLTIDGEVATLCALIDELGLERVSLLGGSSGSCTAVAFAASISGARGAPGALRVVSQWRGDRQAGCHRRHPGSGARALGTRLASSQRPLPDHCRACRARALRAAAAGVGDCRDRCRAYWISSTASTCASTFPSSAGPTFVVHRRDDRADTVPAGA